MPRAVTVAVATAVILGSLGLPGTASPATAQAGAAEEGQAGSREYAECMRLAARRPGDGFETALAWRDMGGGAPAEHCAAAALVALGLYPDAAQRLESVGNDPAVAPALRTRLLEQAGQAWLLAEEPARAEATFAAALTLAPDDVDVLLGRAEARAALGDYRAALDDLDAAAARAPERAEVFALRAAAHRYLQRIEAARADVLRALDLDPLQPEALLELGILKRLAGETEHAREAWMRVLAVAPDSAAAAAARENIERMDVEGRAQGGGAAR